MTMTVPFSSRTPVGKDDGSFYESRMCTINDSTDFLQVKKLLSVTRKHIHPFIYRKTKGHEVGEVST